MSRLLSGYEEIQCHRPRLRSTGEPAITLKDQAFQSQPLVSGVGTRTGT
jgi:hypothetical protein